MIVYFMGGGYDRFLIRYLLLWNMLDYYYKYMYSYVNYK